MSNHVRKVKLIRCGRRVYRWLCPLGHEHRTEASARRCHRT